MTPKQKRIVATLVIADIAVILMLVVLTTRPAGDRPSPPPPSHTPPFSQQTCEWRATQLLAQAGLGGTVTLTPDGLLRFGITYPLAPHQTADDAAQLVWTAFDIALALREQEEACAAFSQVEVTVLAHDDQTNTQISASVSTTDLIAFGAGELSEAEFIARVTYDRSAQANP